MSKTLTTIVGIAAASLAACGTEPKRIDDTPKSNTAVILFNLENRAFAPKARGSTFGYDTDGNLKTVEEVVTIAKRHYGIFVPLSGELNDLDPSEWEHLIAPGATPTKYKSNKARVMTPVEQKLFNDIASVQYTQ